MRRFCSPLTVLGVVGVSACFPGPLDSSVADARDGVAADTNAADGADGTAGLDSSSSDGETTSDSGRCSRDDDCDHLDDACHAGDCTSAGECEPISLTGGACDDGVACTQGDSCAGGTCVGTVYACDDGLTCTDEACDGAGGCVPTLRTDACFIDGACHAPGDVDPARACFGCASGTQWTPLDGACEDANPCTVADSCEAGVCQPGRAPDDQAAGDWLLFPATFEVDEQYQTVLDIKPALGSGVLVLGEFIGGASFANGRFVGRPVLTHYLAEVSSNGEVAWLVVIDGASQAQLLGRAVGGEATLALSCVDCVLTLDDDSEWEVPTTSGRLAAVVFIDDGLDARGFVVSDRPRVMGALDETLAVVDVAQDPTTVLGASSTSVEFARKSINAHRGLVRYDSTGAVTRLGEAYLDDADVASGDWTSLDVVGAFPEQLPFAASAVVLIESTHQFFVGVPEGEPTSHVVEGETFAKLFRIVAPGVVNASSVFMRGNDTMIPGGAGNTATIVPTSDGYFLASRFTSNSILVGEGGDAFVHASTQTYSYVGPIIGSGGEGYVARFTDTLQLEWALFIEPAGSAPTGIRGTGIWSMVPFGESVLVSASLTPNALINDRLVQVGALLAIDSTGSVDWVIEVPRKVVGMVGKPTGDELIIGGATTGGQYGVGPTSIVRPEDNRAPPVGWVQRANSEGGLRCEVP